MLGAFRTVPARVALAAAWAVFIAGCYCLTGCAQITHEDDLSSSGVKTTTETYVWPCRPPCNPPPPESNGSPVGMPSPEGSGPGGGTR